MSEANDIVKELTELQSPLAGMPRSMPYDVPAGYFNMLEESVLAGILPTEDYRLAAPKAIPYDMSGAYFDTLPERMLAAAQHKHSKAPAYIVPEGYFDNLPAEMLEKAKQQWETPKKKVIPLWKNLAWAAAAVLLLSIGFEIYKVTRPAEGASVEQQLAQLPNGTINDYVQAHIDEFDTEIIAANITAATPEQLDETDIINYLDETGWDETTIN